MRLQHAIRGGAEMGRMRFAKLYDLQVPKSNTVFYGDRSFRACGPGEWNQLPLETRLTPSVDTFKDKPKKCLSEKHFG